MAAITGGAGPLDKETGPECWLLCDGDEQTGDRAKAPEAQPKRRRRRSLESRRGTLDRSIYLEHSGDRISIEIRPASSIKAATHAVFDCPYAAKAHLARLKATLGYPVVNHLNAAASAILGESGRHIRAPGIRQSRRADGAWLVELSPCPIGVPREPPKVIWGEVHADNHARWLSRKHGSARTGSLEIVKEA